MISLNVWIDLSDSVKKCNEDIDALIADCEDLEGLSNEQQVTISNIVNFKLEEYFSKIKTSAHCEVE